MKGRTAILMWACLPISCLGLWLLWPFVFVGSAPRGLDEVSMAMWTRPTGRVWYLDNLARQPRVMEQGRLLNWCLGINGARRTGKANARPLTAVDLVSIKQDDDHYKLLALAVGRDEEFSHYSDSHIAWAFVRIGFWDIATHEPSGNYEYFFTQTYTRLISRLDEERRISAIMSADITAMVESYRDVMRDSEMSGYPDPYDRIHELRDRVLLMLEEILAHSRERKTTLGEWCVRYRRSVAMHWLVLSLIARSNQYLPARSSGAYARFRSLTPVAADWEFFENEVIKQIDELLGHAPVAK